MLTFTGNLLDRASAQRADPAFIAARRADSGSGFVPVWNLKLLVAGGAAVILPPGRIDITLEPCVFLGLRDGRALFALGLSGDEDIGALLGGEFCDMRAAALALPGEDAAMLGQARSLIDWHQRHRFCPNCAVLTRAADGGYRRLCPNCGAEHFPRTDPVVIMLPVWTDENGEEQCLIGRNAKFPGGLYSAFAGFVEPGESLEEAVARELREEVGLGVGAVSYRASQPWPFPSSLMIGCRARALSRDIACDGVEITDARWMTKTEIRKRLRGEVSDEIALPSPIAIARLLIEDWAKD